MSSCKEVLGSLTSRRGPLVIDWVKEHLDEINAARERGVTYREIHHSFQQSDDEIAQTIAFHTLTTYVARLNREAKKSRLSVVSPLPTPKAKR